MRKIYIGVLFCLILIGTVVAQDATSPERFALARIEEAQRSGTIELSLFSLGLDELPPEIGNLTNLQLLDLSGNNLKVLPPEIWQLTNLRILDLEFNVLQVLPPEISSLSNLEVLDLSSNWLRALSPEIGQLGKLQELHLDNNRLSDLPPEIGNLSHLCYLKLDNNMIDFLPPEIGQLSGLQANQPCRAETSLLSLEGNRWNFPPDFVIDEGTDAVLAYVREEYEAEANRSNQEALERIEETRETGVTELDLSGLGLTMLPPEIWELSNLAGLNLAGNHLRALPAEIGNLSHLERLVLSGNNLRTLPPEIGNLRNLTVLRVDYNELSSLPPEIGNLTNLTEFRVDNNLLKELPAEIGNLSNLFAFHPEHNLLRSLPPEIGNMTNLELLGFWANQLTSLPPEIGNLSNLLHLDLADNLLSSLPPEIGNLSSLTHLGLSYNRLSSLPPEIANLQLCYLNISQNHFEAVPDVLASFDPASDCRDSGIRIDDETVLEDGASIADLSTPSPMPFDVRCADGLPSRVVTGGIAYVSAPEAGFNGVPVYVDEDFTAPAIVLPLGTRFRVITGALCLGGETTWAYIETLDGAYVGLVREGLDSETYFIAPDS